MATLIPSFNSCKPRMTSGERRFAERLETKLEDDYLLWYDVAIGSRALHPDFIIIHPRRGILILEVKDWRTDTIQTIDRAQAAIMTPNGIKHVVNPFEQARQYAQEVVDIFKRDPLLVTTNVEKYRGQLALPWSFGVVFPNITRQQFSESGMEEVLTPNRVICSDEMHKDVDHESFQKRLWDMFPWWLDRALTMPQIERMRWHLFPEIRLATPKQQPLLQDEIPDVILLMDTQQELLARSLGDGHRVIHGVAGSGKTMILTYRCQHLANLMPKPLLVLCYNKMLAAHLQEIIVSKGLAQRVTARSFHGWCRDQLVQYHVELPPSMDDAKEYVRQLVERLVSAVAIGQVPVAQYGAVLIDEGHDFQPEWLQLAAQMIDPETNSLLLLYDDAQSIYGGRRQKFSFKSVGVLAQGRTTVLRLNYRNTAEVLKVAYDFAKEVLAPADADDDGVPLVLPQSANRHGPMPELTRLPTLRHEGDYLARRFRQLNADGLRWRDLAVVYRVGFVAEEITSRLRDAGIPVELLAKRRGPLPAAQISDSVKVVTFHSSKGLEYPVVAIPGLGFLPHEREDERDEIRLAYVAMTRAMDRLIMTCHRDSKFVKRLAAAGAVSPALGVS